MEIFLIKLLQFMLAISLLVLLHESGHFFFSKLFGVRVEKFYLFFNPWFHIFEFKPRNSETTYGLGWLPLGGYCKIAGMIDESMDTEQMKQPEQPWEFRSKPAWQRLFIMIGGVLVNFLLALLIYSMIMFTWGENYIALKDMSKGMQFSKEAKALGFQDHDILIGTENVDFKSFDVNVLRSISEAREVRVLRKGKPVTVSLSGKLNLLDMLKSRPAFVRPWLDCVVDSVAGDSPAMKMGLAKGDTIVSVDGKKIDTFGDFSDCLAMKGEDLTEGMSRADSLEILTTTIVASKAGTGALDTAKVVLTADAKLGFVNKAYSDYKETHVDYGFFESFPAGVSYGINVLKGYVSDMKYVFTSEGAKSLGGFGAIGSLFPDSWNWYLFWKMTAFLSIILAFMNILPIPALDGGHVLFLLYEMITHRKPSEKFMVWAEYIGIGLLMLLMIVANLNDILRWLGYM